MSNVDNFTLAAWVNPGTHPADHQVIIANGTKVTGYQLGLSAPHFATGGGYNLTMNYCTVAAVDSGVTLTPGQWYFVACKRDSGTTQFYVDGVPAGNIDTHTPITPGALFGVGYNLDVARWY